MSMVAVSETRAGLILTNLRGTEPEQARRITGGALNAENQVMVSGVVGWHS